MHTEDIHKGIHPPSDYNLDRWLHEIAHFLPSQSPLKDFIHHNTLHAFQNRPFELAVEEASVFYGTRAYESFEFYKNQFSKGAISPSALDYQLKFFFLDEQERLIWKRKLIEEKWEEAGIPTGISSGGIREQWKTQRGVELDALSHPIFYRLLSNFLDQGVALSEMPGLELGFFKAISELVKNSWLPLIPLSGKPLKAFWDLNEDQIIQLCLERMVLKTEHHTRYLTEMLFRHPGWSGMVVQIQQNPGSLLAARSITLKQAIAIELMIELGWLYRKLGEDFEPLSWSGSKEWHPIKLGSLNSYQIAKCIWHGAFERTYYEEFFSAIKTRAPKIETPTKSSVQAAFCIDDRSGGIRRHLEERFASVETFGVAGFIGIDVMYQGTDDCYPAQHCPIVLKPKHLLRSKPVEAPKIKKSKQSRYFYLENGANTLFRGWLISQVLGFGSAIRLAINIFRPGPSIAMASSLSKVETNTELHLLRTSEEITPEGYLLGFSYEEMADRVAGLLKQIGATEGLSDLFLLVAHGASSANNPHFAAYDCGACSGKPGAPNARAFAKMANDSKVRAMLKDRGVEISPATHFVGCIHDTTRDEIVYFDEHLIPQSHHALFNEFQTKMEQALEQNAQERCRRFQILSAGISSAKAHQEVRRRSAAIFEPRPELNHATNTLCIIGRRKWTRGLFMDRRAFMNSYDPEKDPQGTILTAILSAAVPVCGGINLEYFFSRIDNQIYGAGTKLPHNVFGLIGVANGVGGDLCTGLPSQMIEMHDPIRLMILVEHSADVALQAAKKNPVVWEWIENHWVFYSCFDPKTGLIFEFKNGQMIALSCETENLQQLKSSSQVASMGSENLPFYEVSPV